MANKNYYNATTRKIAMSSWNRSKENASQLEDNASQIKNQKVMTNEIEIIAHRGFDLMWPENTLYAMKKALNSGANGIEIDVQWTSDKEMVIIHDDTVDRTTSGTGNVKELTSEYVLNLDAGSKFNARYAGLKIPTLEQVLQNTMTGRIYIEIKSWIASADIQQVAQMVVDYGLEDRTVIIGFNYTDWLYQIRSVSNKIQCGCTVGSQDGITTYYNAVKNDINSIFVLDYTIATGANLKMFKGDTIDAVVYTVNNYNTYKALSKLGYKRFICSKWFGGAK